MFYLGQSVIHKPFHNSPPKAAIISGFNAYDAPIITFVTPDGELKKHEQSFMVDVSIIRKKYAKSPTGFSIYTGKFAKIGFTGTNVKLRLAEDEALVAELKTAQKYINAMQEN